ncbi:MAG: kinase [Zetaproteobacteria bacterium CG1_02_53_45]|nr:MAG: kinase [Zetaproteobacteria bacterium CG1_02_53_45]
MFSRLKSFINPPKNPDIESAFNYQMEHLPTLWLLGKTGAGKSSLIHAVTKDSEVVIGDGFRPCTRTSSSYDFPKEKPLMRFLDTRGLGEADYDATEDIAECQGRSNALIIVMKAEDPEQGGIINALKQIKKSRVIKALVLVHTGVHLIACSQEREQCIAYNQSQVDKAWGSSVAAVNVDFELEDGSSFGVEALKSRLADLVPILAQLIKDEAYTNSEEKVFAALKTEVLWYAGTAGASDAIPAVGLVSVPLIQGKMLHSLANQYGIDWDKKTMSEFIGSLGAGFGIQYASRLGLRQLVKLIPVYGQTVGAATAVAISFCSTYAIGRVGCKYMYHKNKGESVPEAELKDIYRSAFDSMKEVAKNETNKE